MTTRGSRATEDEVASFPHRYEVGDDVEVGLDGRSSLYPYDQGWGEGTIIKVHPLVSEFPKGAFHGMDPSRLGAAVPYMVQLKKGKTIVPCPIDDPDFIRAKGAKYQTGAPTRFKVGDSVECKIGPGPDDWIPGTVRALWQPYPGWGRGWRELGMFGYERDPRQTPDCCPYHVTPDGKRFDGKVVGATNIMVPADNDGYIRTSAKFREKAATDAIEAAEAAGKRGAERHDAVIGAYKESISADPSAVAALDRLIALIQKTVELAVAGLGSMPEKKLRRAIRERNPRKMPRKGDAKGARTILLKLLIEECKRDAEAEGRFHELLESLGPNRNVGGFTMGGGFMGGGDDDARHQPRTSPPDVELRFSVGDRVECRVARGPDGWAPGTVVAHWFRNPDWPPGKYAPYQIKLDDSENLIFAPKDRDDVIRLVGSGADAR